MPTKPRPNVSSFLSTSAKAHETEQNLVEAQEKILTLERELTTAQERLQTQIGARQISQAVVPISDILRRSYKSRREKDPQKFAELLHSIETYGFRGSIWLQRQSNGQLRLIAGETRLDAAIAAGYQEIPADIVEVDEITAVKLSRVENARRKDLNALDDTEELLHLLMLTLQKDRDRTIECLYRYKNSSEGKASIADEESLTIEAVFEEVAPEIGLLTFISSRLPLLKLPEDVLKAYDEGLLEYTKAIVLGRVQDESLRRDLIQEVLESGLSLAALKAKIKPRVELTPIDRVEKVNQQTDDLNSKSIAQLSTDERDRLKIDLLKLKASVQKKIKELDGISS